MKNRFLRLFFLSCLLVSGCDKPNSSPELIDPIYSELSKTAEELKKSIPEAEKGIEEAKAELEKVKPQTGQIEYARKRLQEAKDRLSVTKQQAMYFEFRAESRMHYDRDKYQAAWKKNPKDPAWPDPKEYEQYKAAEAASKVRDTWDYRGRLKATGVTLPNDPGAKKEAGKPKEGGEPKEKKPE